MEKKEERQWNIIINMLQWDLKHISTVPDIPL